MLLRLELAVLALYKKWISPLLGTHCRYQPTCSQYAVDALSRHGLFRGNFRTMKRIARCAPWGGTGWDPA